MELIKDLLIDIYADGADLDQFIKLNKNSIIKGFTTNPSLMKKSGVEDYKQFAINLLKEINEKPISFEVFADELDDMEKQALEIASWANNTFVKIPITNTKGEKTNRIIQSLSQNNVKCNVTAVFTIEQVKDVIDVLNSKTEIIISIFAGRIADTGIDPINIMQNALEITKKMENIKILWASPRELLNIFQANKIGVDIITIGNDILKKFEHIGKNHNDFSLETVKMFYDDALKANYKL